MLVTTPATPAPTDPLLVAIVSVILTLLVSAIVAGITGFLARRSEHRKWLRERRFEAYQELVAGADFMNAVMAGADLNETKRRAGESIAALGLVASAELYVLGVNFQDASYAQHQTATTDLEIKQRLVDYQVARQLFLNLARKELGIGLGSKREYNKRSRTGEPRA